ncbi:hypothetical protein GJ496_001570 [Pomphorhynchus laevis]|nr:hypothetical protein GJ496_001570 [Pomphorhynchus laevis]
MPATRYKKTQRIVNLDQQKRAKGLKKKLKRQADPILTDKRKQSNGHAKNKTFSKHEVKKFSHHNYNTSSNKDDINCTIAFNENSNSRDSIGIDPSSIKPDLASSTKSSEIIGQSAKVRKTVTINEPTSVCKNLDEDMPSDLDKNCELNHIVEPIDDIQNTIQNDSILYIQDRMNDLIDMVHNWSTTKSKAQLSRGELMTQLQSDLALYYAYNEFLMERILQLFPVKEAIEFLDASEAHRPLTIRCNTLKTHRRDLAQILINRGANVDPIGDWSSVGLVVYDSQVPIGATPEYMAGHYMLQGASSLLPVMALDPQTNEKILDLCCAPGGKTTHIGALMRNTVRANVHRMGVLNCLITNIDGRIFNKYMHDFDRVLVDAPCTGTGVISKDPEAKCSKTELDIQRCSTFQRQLLLTAIDCINAKSGNNPRIIVYSTCSVLVAENEAVIEYALKKRPNVRIIPTGIEFGIDGFTKFRESRFHPSMKLCRRFYPHTHNMDGFFVAKLIKLPGVTINAAKSDDASKKSHEQN